MGIGWKRVGDLVVGQVVEITKSGQHQEVLHITYSLEQAALNANQLLAAIAGRP